MRRLSLLFAVLSLLAGGLLAGAAAAAASLVGTWGADVPDGRLTVIFRDDGTLTMTLGDAAATDGTWALAGDDLTLVLTDPHNGEQQSFACKAALSDDSLTIQPGEQQCGTTKLTRQN